MAAPLNLNPINNFCSRWYHQSVVKNQTLYIDGGLETFVHVDNVNNQTKNTSDSTTLGQNNYLIAIDLSSAWNWRANISQKLIFKTPDPLTGTSPPVKVRGALYQGSASNPNVYLFGGTTQYLNTSFPGWEQTAGQPTPESPQYALWSYNTENGNWVEYDVTSASPEPPSSGAWTEAPDQGLAFYFNGEMDNGTSIITLSLENVKVFLEGLIVIDTAAGTAKNLSTADVVGNQPRTRGTLSYVSSVGPKGILVAIGGTYKTADELDSEETANYVAMDSIDVFDINSYYQNASTWYKQNATGDIPPARAEFCSVVVSTLDGSSHNIYVYGGQGPNNQYYDDIYVLSLPSFTWTLLYGPGISQRWGHTCHLVGTRTMLTVGGLLTAAEYSTDSCDWEYRSVAVLDMTTMAWGSVFEPDLPAYVVPDALAKTIGGANGTALLTQPPNGFSDPKLAGLFASKNGASGGSITTGSRTDVAAIVGGIVGGLIAAVLLVVLIWFRGFRQHRSERRSTPEGSQSQTRSNDGFQDPTLTTSQTVPDGEKVKNSPSIVSYKA